MPFLLFCGYSDKAHGALEGRLDMKALKDVVGVAAFWGISTWSVRKLEREGKLKAVRIGRRVLFEEEELERFVAERKRVAAPTETRNGGEPTEEATR